MGFASLTANADGTWNSTLKYTAFGELRSAEGTTPTKFQYTGQLSQMDEIGLYYYVARFYDPYLNHFIQADSIVPQPGMSVAYDRYAYVRWNPIRYNDPTGHYLVEGDWLSPDSGTYSAGYYQYGNTVLLNPEDAAQIYGVATPMRVAWATLIDPDNQFEKYAIGLMLAPEFAARNMPPGFLERGLKGSVSGGLQKDALGDPDCVGCGYAWKPRDPREVLMPNGERIGTFRKDPKIRTIENESQLRKIFSDLTVNAEPVSRPGYEGVRYSLPGGGEIGFRETSESGGPAIDIKIPGINIKKIHIPIPTK